MAILLALLVVLALIAAFGRVASLVLRERRDAYLAARAALARLRADLESDRR